MWGKSGTGNRRKVGPCWIILRRVIRGRGARLELSAVKKEGLCDHNNNTDNNNVTNE